MIVLAEPYNYTCTNRQKQYRSLKDGTCVIQIMTLGKLGIAVLLMLILTIVYVYKDIPKCTVQRIAPETNSLRDRAAPTESLIA
jgi:hypothetical protein